MKFSIFEVTDDTSSQLEQLGTKAKEWFWSKDGTNTLFKEGRPDTGENWAEKACCEVARLLELPHAEYELATRKGKRGVITPTLVPIGGRLILGNELLANNSDKYDQYVRYKSSQHVLRLVLTYLKNKLIGMPIGWSPPNEIKNAAAVFMGYLLLDALVCNQDRHHENWGVIITPESGTTLAATFDHASSLGRNEKDKSRLERLDTKDSGYSVQAYVEKARSGLYETVASKKTMLALDAFIECAKTNPQAAKYWTERLASIQPADFSRILSDIPDDWISEPARNFANKMLIINKERILNAYKKTL